MTPPFQIAVVGAGLMGRWHAHTVAGLRLPLVAVVDQNLAAAQRLSRRFNNAAVYPDLAALWEARRIDAVHICTPAETHFGLALESLAAGAHALVEKPLAGSVDEARQLYRAAAAADRVICPVHQFAFQRGVTVAARALPTLGEPLRFSFTLASAGGAGSNPDQVVAEILPHPLSLLLGLWPQYPLDVSRWRLQRQRAGEWSLLGEHGPLSVSLYLSLHARPPRCGAAVYCSGGTLHLNLFHGYAMLEKGRPTRGYKIAQPLYLAAAGAGAALANLARRVWRRQPAYPGLEELCRRFYAAAAGRAAPPVSAANAAAVLAAVQALSAR